MILHICGRAEWAAARTSGDLRTPSLAEVGFVHCSDPGTVVLPANRMFPGRNDLVLLEIDPGRLRVPVRWEQAPDEPSGISFPHVYGSVPVTAVIAVHEFPLGRDGRFRLPKAVAER